MKRLLLVLCVATPCVAHAEIGELPYPALVAERAQKTVAKPAVVTPEPAAATTPQVTMLRGRLVRVTSDEVVIHNRATKNRQTLSRSGAALSGVTVGDEVEAQIHASEQRLESLKKVSEIVPVVAPSVEAGAGKSTEKK
jgi:hypothetical protein